jgi:hypothetical protein
MMTYGFDDFGFSVALASNGDVFASGGIRGRVDFDPGPGEYWLEGDSFNYNSDPYANSQSYVARYSPSKELIWAQTIPNSWWTDLPLATYSDASGDYLYHGWFDKTALESVFGKFDQNGTLLWQKNFTPPHSMTYAVDAAGSIYFCGPFNGAIIDFDLSDGPDPTPLTGDTLTSDGDDVFVMKWDASGNFVWLRQIGGPGNQGAPSIAVDASGVYVSGQLGATLIPPGSAEAYSDAGDPAAKDGFLIRMGFDGSYTAGSTGHFVDAEPKSLALGDGAIFVAGGSKGGQDVDPGPGTFTVSATDGDFFVRVASPTSSPIPAAGGWAYAHMWGGAIAYADGALYMTGKFGDFGGTFDFDPDPNDVYNMTTSGFSDIYIYKVAAADGDFLWARQMGSSRLEEYGTDIAVTGNSVFTTGIFSGYDTDLDPSPTQGAFFDGGGDRQVYVSSLDTSGNYQWAFDIGAKVRIIDDGAPESLADADSLPDYQETAGGGGGWKRYLRGGYASYEIPSGDQDARMHSKGNGSGTATWRFSGLVPNQPYQVNTSFRPDAKNATNSPFKVNGSAPVPINQRVAPNSFNTSFFVTANWVTIGTYQADSSGNIVVELNDKANGNVVADAVLVFPTGPGSGGTSSAANISDTDLALLALMSDEFSSLTSRSRKR